MAPSFVCLEGDSSPPKLQRASLGEALTAPRTHLSPSEIYFPAKKAGHKLKDVSTPHKGPEAH